MIYLKILKISKKILITIDKTRKFDKFFWFFFNNGRLRKKYIGNLYFKLVSNILFIKSKSISFLNLYCSLIKLILFGFLKFYQFFIEMRGTGFKFELQNTTLFLKLGFSHIIQKAIPAGIILYLLKSNLISLKSFDLQYVKEFCFNLKTLRLLDSYKGKGICFKQELPILKVGKKIQHSLLGSAAMFFALGCCYQLTICVYNYYFGIEEQHVEKITSGAEVAVVFINENPEVVEQMVSLFSK